MNLQQPDNLQTVQSLSPKFKGMADISNQHNAQVYSTYEESQGNIYGEETLANPTKSNQDKTTSCDRDSLSEEEDMVYVPFEYQGDGRKREAKRHKSQVLVAQDEIALDQMIKDYQNQNEKIIEIEQELESLKTLNISKKELQSKRNRLTAQLSRDRQKLEMSFLKAMAVNYQRLLRRLDKKLNTNRNSNESNSVTSQSSFCPSCHQKLSNSLLHHKNNLANPQQFKDNSEKALSAKERPEMIDLGINEPKMKKKKKVDNILSDSESPKSLKDGSSASSSMLKKESKISEKRKGKSKAKLQHTRNRLGQAATVVGMFGMLGYVDRAFQYSGSGTVGQCETGLVEANQTTYQPVRDQPS